MENGKKQILMGNEAIGRGLVEAGCSLMASYPGTPASEILESVVTFAKETDAAMHIEWSINEKVAYEVALGNSMAGKRSAVAMKQVGLNVASDPFTRSAYLGVTGGLIIVAADDPGPHSSQTEQDSRFFAMFARVPVFDPSSPTEAKEMVPRAFALSEKYEMPVMIRPTTRVCHARQNVVCRTPERLDRPPSFVKNPARWVATPQFVTPLHRGLNEKIDAIAQEKELYPSCLKGDDSMSIRCIVASGVAYAHIHDLLDDMGYLGRIDFYKVDVPFPLHRDFIETINTGYEQVLVVEETYPTIEMQLANRKIQGRVSKFVPDHGELTPEILSDVLQRFLGDGRGAGIAPAKPKGNRPTLCPGCPHRAAFYAIKETFPQGIFPSDIGCYTLGMNFGAVDSCHCMGACISQGAGLYHAFAENGVDFPAIVVTIGDSTYLHAGIPGLINAVFTGARMIVVILDNSTTAMTGNQPTPATGMLADGGPGTPVHIPELVKASGVRFLRECDPYDYGNFVRYLKEADDFCRSAGGGVAVLVSKHPCLMDREARESQVVYRVSVSEGCTGCRHCVDGFECPALVFNDEMERVIIDDTICVGCGVCETVCPAGAIVVEREN